MMYTKIAYDSQIPLNIFLALILDEYSYVIYNMHIRNTS